MGQSKIQWRRSRWMQWFWLTRLTEPSPPVHVTCCLGFQERKFVWAQRKSKVPSDTAASLTILLILFNSTLILIKRFSSANLDLLQTQISGYWIWIHVLFLFSGLTSVYDFEFVIPLSFIHECSFIVFMFLLNMNNGTLIYLIGYVFCI